MKRSFLERTGTIMDYLQLFNNLVNLAAIDGKFTDEEVQILAERSHVWNISSDEFETAMAGISEGLYQVQVPEDYPQRVELMKQMIRLMAADGHMDELEKGLCAVAAARMDFSEREFDAILNEVIGGAC